MAINVELNDKTPFYIRLIPIKEEKKIIEDKNEKRMFAWNLKKCLSSYSSPIMLIPRKISGIPCLSTDFRHLKSKPFRLNSSFPWLEMVLNF